MANGQYGGGRGLFEEPYLVEDILDFRAMISERLANGEERYYKIVNNLNFDTYIYENGWETVKCPGGGAYKDQEIYKYIDGNNKQLIITEHRDNSIMQLSDYAYVTFYNIILRINSNCSGNEIFEGSSVSYYYSYAQLEFINSTIEYNFTFENSRGLFRQTYLNNCLIHLYNIKYGSNKNHFPTDNEVYLLGGAQVNCYRCDVICDIDVYDHTREINSYLEQYIWIVRGTCQECYFNGVFSLDINDTIGHFAGSYSMITYKLFRLYNSYSEIKLWLKYRIFRSDELNDDGSLSEDLTQSDVDIGSLNKSYINGLIRLENKLSYDVEASPGKILVSNDAWVDSYINDNKVIYAEYTGTTIDDYVKSSVDMQNINTYSDWDFENIWIKANPGLGYPYLRWYTPAYGLTVKVQSKDKKYILPYYRLQKLVHQLRFSGTTKNRALRLVDVDDTNASPVRIMTKQGIKAISLY